MLTFIKENKLFVAIALLAVCGGGYYFFTQKTGSTDLVTTTDSSAVPEAEEILQKLSTLQEIQLDESVFRDPVYLSLSDFGVVLTPEPIGRRNPFLPITFAAPANQITLPGKK